MGTYLILTFAVTAIMGFPVWAVLAASSFMALEMASTTPLIVVVQRMFTASDSFPLLAIPLFMVAGNLMETGGISRRLIDFCDALIGNVTGSLSMVGVLACMFFGAISGSGPATVAAIGGIMIPSMVSAGYDKAYAAALMSAAGALGVIIPPSIAMVNFGIVGNVSIAAMFASGFVPGILFALTMMIVCYFMAKKYGYGVSGKKETSLRKVWQSFRSAIFSLLMPIVVLGGIYGGIFTPTEAAGVAVFMSFITGMFIYKELSFKQIPELLMKAGRSTAVIMMIIVAASGFGWIMTSERIPDVVAASITSISSSKIVIMLIINIFLLIIGTFMETTALIYILTPILLPAAIHIGINPVHFGIIMITNLAIGMSTPPVGVNLFVACGISKLSVEAIFKKIGWVLAANIAALLIITYVEPIALIVPKLLGLIH